MGVARQTPVNERKRSKPVCQPIPTTAGGLCAPSAKRSVKVLLDPPDGMLEYIAQLPGLRSSRRGSMVGGQESI